MERNATPLLHDQGAGVVAGGETYVLVKHTPYLATTKI